LFYSQQLLQPKLQVQVAAQVAAIILVLAVKVAQHHSAGM
jgi:hypothetical protein